MRSATPSIKCKSVQKWQLLFPVSAHCDRRPAFPPPLLSLASPRERLRAGGLRRVARIDAGNAQADICDPYGAEQLLRAPAAEGVNHPVPGGQRSDGQVSPHGPEGAIPGIEDRQLFD